MKILAQPPLHGTHLRSPWPHSARRTRRGIQDLRIPRASCIHCTRAFNIRDRISLFKLILILPVISSLLTTPAQTPLCFVNCFYLFVLVLCLNNKKPSCFGYFFRSLFSRESSHVLKNSIEYGCFSPTGKKYMRFEHARILVSMGLLEPMPCGHRGITGFVPSSLLPFSWEDLPVLFPRPEGPALLLKDWPHSLPPRTCFRPYSKVLSPLIFLHLLPLPGTGPCSVLETLLRKLSRTPHAFSASFGSIYLPGRMLLAFMSSSCRQTCAAQPWLTTVDQTDPAQLSCSWQAGGGGGRGGALPLIS